MPKIDQKKIIVESIKEKLEKATLVIFADYRGLTVDEMTELRTKLRQPGVEFKVLKNTMLGFALKQTDHENMLEQIVGPNAVVFSNEDPVGPAKVVFDFAKTHKNLEVKVGILEGKEVSEDRLKAL